MMRECMPDLEWKLEVATLRVVLAASSSSGLAACRTYPALSCRACRRGGPERARPMPHTTRRRLDLAVAGHLGCRVRPHTYAVVVTVLEEPIRRVVCVQEPGHCSAPRAPVAMRGSRDRYRR